MEQIKQFACGNDVMALIAFVKDPKSTETWMKEANAVFARNQKVLAEIANATELKKLAKVQIEMDAQQYELESRKAHFKAEIEGTRESLRAEREAMLRGVGNEKAAAEKIIADAKADAAEIIASVKDMKADAAKALDQARTLLAQAKKQSKKGGR